MYLEEGELSNIKIKCASFYWGLGPFVSCIYIGRVEAILGSSSPEPGTVSEYRSTGTGLVIRGIRAITRSRLFLEEEKRDLAVFGNQSRLFL
jgi:hypothetical protein